MTRIEIEIAAFRAARRDSRGDADRAIDFAVERVLDLLAGGREAPGVDGEIPADEERGDGRRAEPVVKRIDVGPSRGIARADSEFAPDGAGRP